MKKIIYLIIIMFSCDSLEDSFGVGESQENFKYYDFLDYGWAYVFNNESDLAFDYLNQALSTSSIEYYNNTLVAMGWAKTYQANLILNSDQCIDNTQDCTDLVDEERNKAKCFFYRAVLDDGQSLFGKTSTQILEDCSSTTFEAFDNIDIINHSFDESVSYYSQACEVNQQGEVEFDSCFENYILDLKIGYLYLKYLSYAQSIVGSSENDEVQEIIQLFVQFLQQNPNYDIMEDKSNYGVDFSFDYRNIASIVSLLYLNSGNYIDACNYAESYLVDCVLDCESGDVLELIDCLETPID